MPPVPSKDRLRRKREQLEALRNELVELEKAEAARLGQLAMKAGLGDLSVDEAELLAALREVAARFRSVGDGATSKPPKAPAPAPAES